jgi:iron complex transport system substrate-binding protein
MLYAVGAGAQVVAVDEYSNYPEEAAALGTMLSGFEPNIEAISGFTPDLVIASYDPGTLVEQLGALNIPVFIANAATSIDNVYEQIEQIGLLTGHADTAVQLAAQMKTEIEAAIAGVVPAVEPISYFNDYPQLSAEVVVSSDPDLIFLADTKCCNETAATVAARDGWGGLKAVTNNHIVELDDDVASRWGPRIVELVVAIRDAVAMVVAGS